MPKHQPILGPRWWSLTPRRKVWGNGWLKVVFHSTPSTRINILLASMQGKRFFPSAQSCSDASVGCAAFDLTSAPDRSCRARASAFCNEFPQLPIENDHTGGILLLKTSLFFFGNSELNSKLFRRFPTSSSIYSAKSLLTTKGTAIKRIPSVPSVT